MERVAKLALFIKLKDEKGAAFLIRQLFFSIFIFLVVIFALNFSVKANQVEVFNDYYASNNIISISDIIDFSSEDDLEEELKDFKFSEIKALDYYKNQIKGIKFIFDNFAISYTGLQTHGISASGETLKFLNRINNYNRLNKINGIFLGEQKVDFNVLKFSYLSDQYSTKNFKFNFGLDFNYYQGEKLEYDFYNANLNLKNSVNPFYQDPIQVKGNWKEYYNMNKDNQGFGFGFKTELYWQDILFDLDVDNIGASINWDQISYKNKNIDTENANLDEDGNIKYDETITGSWMNFDYKMALPLKAKMKISKKFERWNLGTNLNWQEWRVGDLNESEHWIQSLFAAYNKNNKKYKLEYDFKNSLASFVFDSDYFQFKLLTDRINLETAETIALKAIFKYEF